MDESVYVGGNEAQGYFFSKLELYDKNEFVKKRCIASELSYAQTMPRHRLAFHVSASIKCLVVTAFHDKHLYKSLAYFNVRRELALNSHAFTSACNQCPPERLSNQIGPIRNSNVDASYKRKMFKEDFCTHKCGKWAYKHPHGLEIIHRLAAQPNFLRWQTSQNRPQCFAV
ncbi:hypothetical protein [Pseudomonas sp. PGPR40]|uniref:hypothetical protein n=1 Tax=Pseudomonas sp. PGPR40 TaxID=2913476 RepID=UPI001EDC2D76|nr:hypothetical protein [Pseudomonas sp. PGPR40]